MEHIYNVPTTPYLSDVDTDAEVDVVWSPGTPFTKMV